MRRSSRHNREQGIVIALVAAFMLVVIGAMMALSIDVVTFYTARSEAQLAADSAALAGARVLANSGITSDPGSGLVAAADTLAGAVALQVAEQNSVGGSNITSGEVAVTFGGTNPNTNPTVTVSVGKIKLPTFFARMLGVNSVTVAASATAEAYNPSAPSASSTGGGRPVAPICVKPWLLPNMDPSNAGNPIFDPTTGAVTTASLLGWSPSSTPTVPMSINPLACPGGNCTQTLITTATPAFWQYYPGDDLTTFPHPTNSLPSCATALTTNYQESIAGCIQTPISCNSSANIDLATYPNPNRDSDTADAVNCLTHAANNKGDTVTTKSTPPPAAPFEFVAGDDNPVAIADPTLAGKDVMVSDSLVTVPVIDVPGPPPKGGWVNCTASPCTVQIIGFVQLFLNPDGNVAPAPGPPPGINTTVINLAGCGTSAAGNPILGNGASPVAVRLISPP